MANPNHLTSSPRAFAPFTLGILLCLSLLSGCPGNSENTDDPNTASSSPDTHTSQSTTPTATHSTEPQKNPQASGNTVRQGIFVYGEGFQTFKACGEKSEEVWVIDTPQKHLQKAFTEQQFMELEPVYVEVIGDIVPAPQNKDSFSANYEKALKVKTLKTLSPWMMKKTCFSTDFVATGTRPDWQLKGLKTGDVFFKSNEGEFPIVEVLAYQAPTVAGNQLKYSFGFRTPDEEKLSLTLTKEPCNHAGKSYSHQAEILFRGTTYTGCAEQ